MGDSFQDRFVETLARRRLSQNELARQIGSTSAFISNVANGKAKPGLDFLVKIATQLEVSLDWLVLGKEVKSGRETQIEKLLRELAERVTALENKNRD